MKLSDLFKELIVGTAILPMLIGNVFAVNNVNDIGQYEDLGGNLCTINSDLSFDCENSNNVIVGTDAGWIHGSSSYFRTTSGLAYYIYSNSRIFNNGQGYIGSFEVCGGDVNCNNPSSMSYSDFLNYYKNNTLTNWEWYSSVTTPGWAGPVFIFENNYIYFAPVTSDSNNDIILWKGSPIPYSFGLVGWGLDADYKNVINTPISKPTEYYYSTGSCPSVGQYKYASNLTPDVCYGGYPADLIYTAGEDTLIQAGTGINIFETYAIFSGNMSIQAWYDTYWVYYNNISFNPYPFYNKPKALLGLMLQRQMAGLGHSNIPGSYAVLNYCWYVVNNYSDNSSTCLVPTIQSTYSGINITADDFQFINDSINEDYVVHTPSTGSIFFDPSGGLGGGGTSWGEEECSGIPCLFEKFYQMFTSSRINDVDFSQGGQGFLPSYIALAFVIVVLFYVFKR